MSFNVRRETLAAALAVALSFIVAGSGLASGWPGSASPASITDDQAILVRSVARQDMDLLAVDGGLIAAWASSVGIEELGIVTRSRVGDNWVPSFLISQDLPSWAPSIDAGSNGMVGVWITGEDPEDATGVRALVSFDALRATQPITAGLYGEISPDLAVDSDGDHVVFSAGAKAADFLSGDLYYAFRPDTKSEWDSPVLLVGHTEVISETSSGGIFNPRIAIEPGAGTIHVVWQQKEIDLVTDYESVWHISGTRVAGGGISWGDPQRLSPLSQRYAVLPALVAGDAGEIHVSWTELIGEGTYRPDEQYIHYQRLGTGDLVTLNSLPIHVNVNFPNWSVSSLSVLDETVCAAWHGYEEPQGQYYEEVYFRCSQDNGRSWLQIVQVSDTSDLGSVFPRVVLDQGGHVHIAWVEYETAQGATAAVPKGVFYRTGNPVHGTFLPLVMKLR